MPRTQSSRSSKSSSRSRSRSYSKSRSSESHRRKDKKRSSNQKSSRSSSSKSNHRSRYQRRNNSRDKKYRKRSQSNSPKKESSRNYHSRDEHRGYHNSRDDSRRGNTRVENKREYPEKSDRIDIKRDYPERTDRERYSERYNERVVDRNGMDSLFQNRGNFGGQNSYYNRGQVGSGFQQQQPPQVQQFQMRNNEPQQQHRPPINLQDLESFKKKFISDNDPLHKKSRTEVKEFRKKHDIIIRSDPANVPNPIFNFNELVQLPKSVIDEVLKAGFTAPTSIQSQAFTIALNGSDMIGIAQTGSGKTLAFLIPAIVHIAAQKPITPSDGPIALILTPTRELTLQIMGQFQKFASKTGYQAACLYGGQDKFIQRQQLRYGVQVIIACPGRLIDFLESYYTTLNRVTFLVLDEADRMLDMGFEPQIRRILTQIRPDKQTLLFSATWPKEVQKLALDFCHPDKVHIQIGELDLTTNKHIKQQVYCLRSEEKRRKLMTVLQEIPRDAKAIIFCATKKGCEGLSYTLARDGYKCISIHGDKTQKERDFAMENFKDNRVRLLIATDVASRGLDVRDITYVINYDMPKIIEDYVHRIGRTGRAGAHGISVTFFATDEDIRLANDLIDVLKRADQDVPEELYRASYMKKPPGPKPIPRRTEQPAPPKWDDPQYSQYLPFINQPGLEAPIQVSTYPPSAQTYSRPLQQQPLQYNQSFQPQVQSAFGPSQAFTGMKPLIPQIPQIAQIAQMYTVPQFTPQSFVNNDQQKP